jgi:hypothetical protein
MLYHRYGRETQFSHSSSAVSTLAFSFFPLSLSVFPSGYLGIHTLPLSVSQPTMRLQPLRLSASQASGPSGYISLPPLLSLYWIHFPANALQRPTPNWFHVGDIEFTVTMATSSRQGTLSLSWPPTLSPCVPPSTGLHTLLAGSIFSKRIFDIQYREKGVFFFPLLFPLSELSPPEHIQCSIYIQVFPSPKARSTLTVCSFKRRPVAADRRERSPYSSYICRSECRNSLKMSGFHDTDVTSYIM